MKAVTSVTRYHSPAIDDRRTASDHLDPRVGIAYDSAAAADYSKVPPRTDGYSRHPAAARGIVLNCSRGDFDCSAIVGLRAPDGYKTQPPTETRIFPHRVASQNAVPLLSLDTILPQRWQGCPANFTAAQGETASEAGRELGRRAA